MSRYAEMGGRATFEKLVSHFYALVAVDPILRPMYPDEDFKGAAERLLMFLEQYWGGPTTYSEQRGHPRLRMRHAQFQIGENERDVWLKHMQSAVNELEMREDLREELWNYLVAAAHSIVNQPRTF
jgi:hemoglobin